MGREGRLRLVPGRARNGSDISLGRGCEKESSRLAKFPKIQERKNFGHDGNLCPEKDFSHLFEASMSVKVQSTRIELYLGIVGDRGCKCERIRGEENRGSIGNRNGLLS